MIKNKIYSGQSMFEVLIALFIITMIIVGVVSLSTNSISNSVFSRNKTLAGKLSQEATEWLRSQREQDIAGFITRVSNSSTYCLQTLSWINTGTCGSLEVTDDIFIRQVSFQTVSVDGKSVIEATVTTSWTDSKGYHESKSVNNFTDIRERD